MMRPKEEIAPAGPAACRGCLATDVKLYSIIESRLVENYAQLVGISLQDHYTQHLCFICASLLQKFSTFRERCKKAYQFLTDAEFHGKDITTYIRDIDLQRYSNQFKLPYVQTETLTKDYIEAENDYDDEDYEYKLEIVDSHRAMETEEMEDSNLFIDEEDLYVLDNEIEEKVKENDDCTDGDGEEKYKRFGQKFRNKKSKTFTEEEIIEYANSCNFNVTFLTEEEQYAETEKRKKENKYPTQCNLCGKGCSSQSILDKHYERSHNKNYRFECSICHCRFQKNNGVLEHLLMHKCVYQCKSCPLTTKYRCALQGHYSSHNGIKHACDYCEKEFKKRTTYLSHVRLHHASELPWCDICGESFMNKKGMAYHIGVEHRSFSADFPCVSCDTKFYSESGLEKHEQLKRCELHSCALCGEAFLTEQLLRYHLVHHQRDTVIACKECGINFHNMPALKAHEEACGAGVPCVQCGGHFVDEAAMLEHVSSEHSAGTNFKCVECDKTFSNSFYYKVHLTTKHRTKSKDGTVSRKRATNRTRRPKPRHPKPGIRRWRPSGEAGVVELDRRQVPAVSFEGKGAMCEVCGKVFFCKAKLDIHMLIHTDERPHQCQRCNKGFRTKADVKTHMSVHSDERPFKCELCPKAFKGQTSLSKHELGHIGDRNHVCHICEKSFLTTDSVRIHIKSVHMKIPAPPRIRRRGKTAVEN